jgi:protein-S-isoprenylcysteine O-methyltransferase Ste14
MRIFSLMILACFTVMGICLVYVAMILRRKGLRPMGNPTIQPVYFYAGKIALFSSWGFLLVNAVMVMAGTPSGRVLCPLPAAIFVLAGSILLILAFLDLGDSLRVGLPGEATTLKTKGIYRFSRNPIYAGVDLIAVASVLFIPVIINVIFAIIGIAIHHVILLSEEKFLEVRFGIDWTAYRKKTRRYF